MLNPSPFMLFGIVNLTPDSFSDGGKYYVPEAALAHAQKLLQEGAEILDLGAESSRPGAAPVSEAQEQARLMPVLQALQPTSTCPVAVTHLPTISVDTYHASTAVAALEAGAHIINDISACQFDPGLKDVVAQYKPGYVLMHSSGKPENMQQHIPTGPIMREIQLFFEKHLHTLTQAGLPEEHIMLDPGIGFGKSVEQNWEILRHMEELHSFGRPLLAAISMKSFLHNALQIPAEDTEARAEATHISSALLAHKGIAYHRVHHVAPTVRALQIVHKLKA